MVIYRPVIFSILGLECLSRLDGHIFAFEVGQSVTA